MLRCLGLDDYYDDLSAKLLSLSFILTFRIFVLCCLDRYIVSAVAWLYDLNEQRILESWKPSGSVSLRTF